MQWQRGQKTLRDIVVERSPSAASGITFCNRAPAGAAPPHRLYPKLASSHVPADPGFAMGLQTRKISCGDISISLKLSSSCPTMPAYRRGDGSAPNPLRPSNLQTIPSRYGWVDFLTFLASTVSLITRDVLPTGSVIV